MANKTSSNNLEVNENKIQKQNSKGTSNQRPNNQKGNRTKKPQHKPKQEPEIDLFAFDDEMIESLTGNGVKRRDGIRRPKAPERRVKKAPVSASEEKPMPSVDEQKKNARTNKERQKAEPQMQKRQEGRKGTKTERADVRPNDRGGKIKIIPLGGLNEVGKNMTLIEYNDEIIIVDCGLGFPDDDMPGIDLVIPDITYLEENKDKIKGLFVTHGHEDHIGAIPYILRKINPTIYGTKLTLGIIRNKLEEHILPQEPKMVCVNAGDVIKLKSMSVEFIRVNHSIADACALAIKTPLGYILHTGDFKLDLSPIEGEMMNITRLGEIGKEGVLMLLCESTNAERPGYTPSEKKVGESLEYIFTVHPDKRIVIATFSSNVHRVQQIINTSAKHGRKVAVTGRSMLNIVSAAIELGYMTVPDKTLIDIGEIKRYKPEELTLITTGSQGEPMSALYRMAFGDHNQVTLGRDDLVILSASAIPGNEKLVGRIINELSKAGVAVLNDAVAEVHVSGHACQEELKLMQALTKPKYFMPIHGEYKHLAANRNLALYMGIRSENIFISDIGKVLEIDKKGARFAGTVTSGVVLVDGYGVGDVGNIVLRDRKHLAQDGLIVVVATVSASGGYVISGPDIVSRGFVYVKESEALMEETKNVAYDSIVTSIDSFNGDWYQVKNKLKDDLTRFLYAKTKRKPMILPIVMDV